MAFVFFEALLMSIVLILISSFGLHLAVLLGLYLLFSKKHQGIANQLLALLLIALALRTGKAIFYNFMDLPGYLKNLALGANLAAAPLLYFYGRALIDSRFSWKSHHWWHFGPAAIYVLFCAIIPSEPHQWWWKLSYGLILLQSYFYVGLCLWMVTRTKNQTHAKWLRILTIGLGFMWIIYGLVFLGWFPYHIAGSISFSVLMLLFFFLIFNPVLLKAEHMEPYEQSRYTVKDLNHYHRQIKRRLQEDELFLQANLTVDRLADHLGMAPRMVSETINRMEGAKLYQFC